MDPLNAPVVVGRSAAWRNSLRFRLAAATLLLVTGLIWGLTLYAMATQRSQLEALQTEQQLADAKYLAADLDRKLRKRRDKLVEVAARLDSGRLDDAGYLATFLEQHYVAQEEFRAGVAIVGLDGRSLVEFPALPERRGLPVWDRDFVRQTLASRQPVIDRPVKDEETQRPMLFVSVPVLDRFGEVRAVLASIADLTAPDFLGLAMDSQLLGRSEIYLISLKDDLIVASSDQARAMTALPPVGASEMVDRLRAGFSGTTVSSNGQGGEKLYSAQPIPANGWVVLCAQSTEIAFQPIKPLHHSLLIGAGVITLLALLAVVWLSRRLLSPLVETSDLLDAMSSGREPLRQLPEAGCAELRGLLAAFNRLSSHLEAGQAELRRSEETYRSLFDNMLNGFAYCRMFFDGDRPADFVYLSVNRAFESLTGLHDVVGRKVSDVIPGIRESDPELFALYGRVVRSGVPESFEIFLAALGQWYAVSVYRPEAGHFVAIFDVVTERRAAEARLRQSEAHLVRAQTQAHLGSWWLDMDSGRLQWSEETYRIFCMAIGTPLDYPTFLAAVHPDDRAYVEHSWQAAMAGAPYDIEHRIVVGDCVKWVRERAELEFAADGSLLRGVGTVQDTTTLKLKEEELLHSRQLLRELAAHREKIREDERAHIAREIHDELGQCLTALRMDISVTAIRHAQHEPELAKQLAGMKKTVDATIGVVRDVAASLRPAALDVGLVSAAEWLLGHFERRTGVRCRLDAPDEDLGLEDAQATAAFRILQESLTNVARHANASNLAVVLEWTGGELIMLVQDDGAGFDHTEVRQRKTFGLMGMRERVIIFGGECRIDSRPGAGTSLYVRIPAHKGGEG